MSIDKLQEKIRKMKNPSMVDFSVDLDQIPPHILEEEHNEICKTFHRWDKNNHLKNMIESNYFRYCREIVFDNFEDCNVERFLALAQSQGSLQTILKLAPELIEKDYLTFQKAIYKIFDKGMDKVSFCYRMRIGVK